MNVQNFVMAAVMAAAFLSAWAADVEEVYGELPTEYPNACEYEKWKGKIVKSQSGKTHDCRYYHILELYGYQGSEGHVAYGLSQQALCSGTVYYCNYIGGGKYRKSPINLTYSGGVCRSDNHLITPRFISYYGSGYIYKRFRSSRLSHECPGEVVPEKPPENPGGNGDGNKPKPDDGNKPKPDDGNKPKPDDGNKPKPDDGNKPKPDDGNQPKPDDGSKPKPDDGSKTDNSSLNNVLRQLNDTIESLRKTIGGLGGGGGGSGKVGGAGGGTGGSGKGGEGGGTGGSGKGDGGAGGKGDGNGKVDGKGDGEGLGSGEDMPGFSADNGDVQQREPFDLGGFSVTGYFTSSGTCPAPSVVDLGVFGRMEMTYDWFCRLSKLIRPVAIAFAWLSALMIIVKGSKRT